MSVIRPKPPQDPIHYDPLAAGLAPSEAEVSRFDVVRPRAIAHPAVTEPRRLLEAYATDRAASELFTLLALARRVRETVDRIVVVAGGPALEAVRCLFATCCHPLHNELPRGERGGRPRLATVDAVLDNDATAAVLDLLEHPVAVRDDLIGRFAVLVIADGGGPGLPHAASAVLRCRGEHGDPPDGDASRPLVICGTAAAVDHLRDSLPPPAAAWETVAIPSELASGIAPFSGATLLPAAILGVDVVRLLEGAVAALVRIAESPSGENPAAWLGRAGSLVGGSSARIDAPARWYAALRTACGLGSPAAVARIDGGESRRDRVLDVAGNPWPVREAIADASVRMPRIDEHSMGQLLETLLAATVVALGGPDESVRAVLAPSAGASTCPSRSPGSATRPGSSPRRGDAC
jgi:hypothetical protein